MGEDTRGDTRRKRVRATARHLLASACSVLLLALVLAGPVLRTIPLATAAHLLVVVDGTARRRRALFAHAAAAVLFVPGAERLAAKHEVVVFDDGKGHPGLLLLLIIKVAVVGVHTLEAACAAVAGCAGVAVSVHLDAAAVVVVVTVTVVVTGCFSPVRVNVLF